MNSANDSKELESNLIINQLNSNNNTILRNSSPEEVVKELNLISRPDDLKIGSAMKEITWIALPTMLFFMTLFLMQTINLVFIGQSFEGSNKQDALNGIGVSHLYINCLALSIVVGLISGYETYGSNAYGAKNYRLMGLYYHRAQIIAYILTTILLTFHFFFAVKILSFFGIDDKVLAYVDEYIKIMMFLIIFDVQFSLNYRYLNIIGKSHVNLIILSSSLLLHPLWCYLLIIKLNLGIQGAAVCLVISQMLNAMGGVFYVYCFNPLPETVFSYNRNSFKGWWQYLKIALPATFLVCSEWWAFEMLSVIAIWIGKVDYTVHMLLSNVNGILYTISIGFGMATSILVGKNLCEKGIVVVKKYIKIIFVYGLIFMLIFLTTLFILRGTVLRMYIDEEDILAKGETVIPLICLLDLFDMIQTILCSVCRGMGKQMYASLITFMNFYLLQTGLGILFGKWLGWGVFGIWFGSMIGCGLSAISYYVIIFHVFDFDNIQLETLQRLQKDSKNVITTDIEVKDEKLLKNGWDTTFLTESFQTT